MKKVLAFLTVTLFALSVFAPFAAADNKTYLTDTRAKAVRGIENGLFGLGGELHNHIQARSEKGPVEAWTLGFFDGLHRGIVRTLVGAYEMATPFYHDEPYLERL